CDRAVLVGSRFGPSMRRRGAVGANRGAQEFDGLSCLGLGEGFAMVTLFAFDPGDALALHRPGEDDARRVVSLLGSSERFTQERHVVSVSDADAPPERAPA